MAERPPGRYATPQGLEGQWQPGSRGRVPRNLLGIRSRRQIDRAEYEALVAVQAAYLERVTSRTRFTARLLRQMHADWLGGIYEWAGQYRHVELSKGGFQWPPAFRVAENMEAFERGVLAKRTPCSASPLPVVARGIAEVHAELLLIHPFREGNDRLARWLADLMALQAGLPLPQYRFSGRGGKARQAAYLRAVKAGYAQDYELLTGFFRDAIDRRLREEADD